MKFNIEEKADIIKRETKEKRESEKGEIEDKILNELKKVDIASVAELQKKKSLKKYSTQKISYYLRILCEKKVVEKVEENENKVIYYRVIL